MLETPQRKEPKVKRPIAAAKTWRVPKRSAIHPLMGINTARLSELLASTAFILSGATCKASETAGTAVLRIVVSSDSMKKATATSDGSSFFGGIGSWW